MTFGFAVAVVAASSMASGFAVGPWRQPAEQFTIFERVAGTWDWSGGSGSCRDNPFIISFSEDHAFMTLTYRKPPRLATGLQHDPERPTEVRYEVRGHSDTSIRAFMVRPSEARRSETGNLVVWDLMLMSHDTFYWRRTDWAPDGKTRALVRCRAE